MNTADRLHSVLNSFRRLEDFLNGFNSWYFLRNASVVPELLAQFHTEHIWIEFKVGETNHKLYSKRMTSSVDYLLFLQWKKNDVLAIKRK